jgi:hypothetical protein
LRNIGENMLIEILASIPYRSWEIRQYARMTRSYRDRALVQEALNEQEKKDLVAFMRAL